MGRKVTEPEHFVYILIQEKSEGSYEYHSDYPSLEKAKEASEKLSNPTKIIRARKATVLRFLKRNR